MASINRIVAIGDSFTLGLGTAKAFEDSQLAGHPEWEKWPENTKKERRLYVNEFRRENSFPKFLADKFKENTNEIVGFQNHGHSGCSNTHIINNIVRQNWEHTDLAVIGFTSSLRDPLPIIPEVLKSTQNKGNFSWSFHEFINTPNPYIHFAPECEATPKLQDFWVNFVKNYHVKGDLLKYIREYNKVLVYFVQQFFEYHQIRYIMFDAFESMIHEPNKVPYIDQTYYWNIGEESCFSYCRDRGDEYLELPKVGREEHTGPRHPSRRGHISFANQLFKFWQGIQAYNEKEAKSKQRKTLI